MNALAPLLTNPASAALLRTAPSSQNPPARLCAAHPQNVVIVYDDPAAGERAVRMLAKLKDDAGPGANLSPIPWSFDFLAELPWRCQALRDVDAADIIILSVSRPDEIPAAINHWIRTCLHRNRVQSIPVMVMFETDDVWTLWLNGAVPPPPAPVAPTPAPPFQRAPRFSPFPFVNRSLQPA